MTVIFYEEGEHDAGFVGFRAVRTAGVNSDYRQAYFSLNDYSYEEAELLAHQKNDEWGKEANVVKKENRKKPRSKSHKKNVIAIGLRAYIGVERKLCKNEKQAYFSPIFIVQKPGYGAGHHTFRINRFGYKEAFKLAVEKYCEIHGYDDTEQAELLKKLPCKTVFTEYLFDSLIKRNHPVTKEEIAAKLSM